MRSRHWRDLQGAVRILCLNENYSKYHDLLVLNNALLVVGEVNNGDDKPKLFPQEIMPLEEEPRRFTKQVHWRLHTGHWRRGNLESARERTAAHPGKCPLFLCLLCPAGEVIFIEAHERFSVMPSRELELAVNDRFGEETYYAKVDSSLPERAPRRWERKSELAGPEE